MAQEQSMSTDEYRDSLNQAKFAAFNRSPVSEASKGFVGELLQKTLSHEAAHHPRKRARRSEDAKAFELAVGAFAADLIKHSGNVDSKGYLYRPADKDDLAATLVSYDALKKLRAYWTEMEIVEETSFPHFVNELFDTTDKTQTYRKARRFRATQTLLDLAQRSQITSNTIRDHFELRHRHVNVVQVRKPRVAII